DEVILGNAVGPGGNLARLTALTAKLPVNVPAVTVDRQCGSGLEAINIACRNIQAGAGDIYIAGGVESSSRAPWKLEKPLTLYDAPTLFTRARFSPDFIGDPDMGVAAENVAEAYRISSQEQHDECPRPRLSMRKLRRLQPIFKEGGTVTAGNACPINDGAAAVLIMSEQTCLKLGLQPILKFVDATSAGVDPNLLGIGPIPAVKKLLKRNQLTIQEIDL